MSPIPIELDQDVVALLQELRVPVKQAARELIILELYRQGAISGGRAAKLFGESREKFIHRASSCGIPYFQLGDEELERELRASKQL